MNCLNGSYINVPLNDFGPKIYILLLKIGRAIFLIQAMEFLKVDQFI